MPLVRLYLLESLFLTPNGVFESFPSTISIEYHFSDGCVKKGTAELTVSKYKSSKQLYTVVGSTGKKYATGYRVPLLGKCYNRTFDGHIRTIRGTDKVKLIPYDGSDIYACDFSIDITQVENFSTEKFRPKTVEKTNTVIVVASYNDMTLLALGQFDKNGEDYPISLYDTCGFADGLVQPLEGRVMGFHVGEKEGVRYILPMAARVKSSKVCECRQGYDIYRGDRKSLTTSDPKIFYNSKIQDACEGIHTSITEDGSIKPLYISRGSKNDKWYNYVVEYDEPMSPQIKCSFILCNVEPILLLRKE